MDSNLDYEARTYDLGEWLTGPWVQQPVESPDGDHYTVTHKASGQLLATLPHWAGSIALWMCVARDAFPALLADNDQLRAENQALTKRLHDAAMTRTWTNEDGKKFVFVEDIAPALLGTDAKKEQTG
ncbi:hypothetical protein [Streptomyces sp. NPDC047868]|uniref:hypothetical protein n=1 Tax=Streptomyces sp. NPDC047868 TaxID=3155480 RepID=UPI003454F50B